MVSARLIKTEDDVYDFCKWLVYRAQQEEEYGKDKNARIYRELAEGIKKVYNGNISNIVSK